MKSTGTPWALQKSVKLTTHLLLLVAGPPTRMSGSTSLMARAVTS